MVGPGAGALGLAVGGRHRNRREPMPLSLGAQSMLGPWTVELLTRRAQVFLGLFFGRCVDFS